MAQLSEEKLERLRDRLRSRGERNSIVMSAVPLPSETSEAMRVVEEFGALCETVFLVMAADGRVSNLERDVLRGALRVISHDLVRSVHMDAMIDDASRKLAEQGRDERLAVITERLRADPSRAELTYILASVVAAADGVITEPERRLLDRLADELAVDEARVAAVLADLERDDP